MVVDELREEVGASGAVRGVDHKRFVFIVLFKKVLEFSIGANPRSPRIGFKIADGSGPCYGLVNSLRFVHEHCIKRLLDVHHVLTLFLHF